eukprot:g3037.t1
MSTQNIWFRFHYFSIRNDKGGKNIIDEEDVLESVMPCTHRTVYVHLPKGAKKFTYMPWDDAVPGNDSDFQEMYVKYFHPSLEQQMSLTFNAKVSGIAKSPVAVNDDLGAPHASIVLPFLAPSAPSALKNSLITPRYNPMKAVKPVGSVFDLSSREKVKKDSDVRESSKEERTSDIDRHETPLQCRDGVLKLSSAAVKWASVYLPLEAALLLPVETVKILLVSQKLPFSVSENMKMARTETSLRATKSSASIKPSLSSDEELLSGSDESSGEEKDVAGCSPSRKSPVAKARMLDKKMISEGLPRLDELSMAQKTSFGLSLSDPMPSPSQRLRQDLFDVVAPTACDNPSTPMNIERTKVCVEILEVEENYVAAMKRMLELRETMLREFKHLKKKMEINAVFGNADVIFELNQILLENLRNAHRLSNRDSIGLVFLKFAPFLKLYTTYLNDVDESQKILKDLKKKNKDLDIFLESKFERLESLLIRPVQQIPRYCLLLKELLKNTPIEHKDRINIEKAAKACAEVASYCNQTLENRRRTSLHAQLKRRFAGQSLLKENKSRQILKEGTLSKVNRYGTDQERVFLLFSDALAYGVGVEGGNVELHRVMYMGDFGVFETHTSENCFEVRTKQKTFIVRAHSKFARKSWLNAIRDALKDAGMERSQDKFWGEEFWGKHFSWEKKEHAAGDERMWELAAKMFAQPPFSDGYDARYTAVKKRLRKEYGRHAINETNKDRLKRLAVNRGRETFSMDDSFPVRKAHRKSILMKTSSFFGMDGLGKKERSLLGVSDKNSLGKKERKFFGIGFGGRTSRPEQNSPARSVASSSASLDVPTPDDFAEAPPIVAPPKSRAPKISSKAAKLLGMAPSAGVASNSRPDVDVPLSPGVSSALASSSFPSSALDRDESMGDGGSSRAFDVDERL